MFNQKVNHFSSQNPDYLNHSLGAPFVKPVDIHNCGTTILKYTKDQSASKKAGIPLQSWCSPHVAVESFAMRPIVNSKEYFDIIKEYLGKIVLTDAPSLKESGLKTDRYSIIGNYATEPSNSFIQAIETNVVNYLNYLMSASTDRISMFNTYNPITEGLVINDIDIQTYQSNSEPNHFLHKVILGVVNTTRYNTISMKAELYQNTSGMMNTWDTEINKVMNSQDVSLHPQGGKSEIYVSMFDFVNNTTCVLGQESECEFKGHNISNINGNNNYFSNTINQNNYAPSAELSWLSYNGLGNTNYNKLVTMMNMETYKLLILVLIILTHF